MAPANLREGISRVLGRANASDGVLIGKEGGEFSADVFIVAAYGVSIPTVARNIAERVEHVCKTQAAIDLSGIRVHAAILRPPVFRFLIVRKSCEEKGSE